MRNVVKKILWLGMLVGMVAAAIILILSVFYPPQYVYRVLVWQQSDVDDYRKFPERLLEANPEPFYFNRDLDEDRVRALFEQSPAVDDLELFLEETRTQAFIVIQNEAVLYEKYFNGATADTIVTSFSVAKSFTSALIGIAIEEGGIHDVNDPITDYLPELGQRDTRFTDITLRHLLMMSSGIHYAEFPFFFGDDAKTYYYPDLRQLALEHTRIVALPGETFLYNNYHPLLLGLILERSTGTSVTDYLQEVIWEPLGMQYAGSWSLDSRASAFEKMESGINARAIDFAKFGRLFLNRGYWEGEQIIPESWVLKSTQMDASIDYDQYYPNEFIFESGRGFYAYMWWGMQRAGVEDDFAAHGHNGQYIYISPHSNLIIVRNGEKSGVDARVWMDLFYQVAGAIGEGS